MKLFVLSVCLFILPGCGSKTVASNEQDQAWRTLYVVDHGWHAGIIIDAGSTTEAITGLSYQNGDITFIEFGWGDQDFYQAASFSLALAFKALFFPTSSVMHVAGLRGPPEVYFQSSAVERIAIPQSRLNKLLSYIDRSFVRDEPGKLIGLGSGLYAESQFYAAKGNYHLFNNCNTWVISALTEAGVVDRAVLYPTASRVMREVRRYNRRTLIDAGRQ